MAYLVNNDDLTIYALPALMDLFDCSGRCLVVVRVGGVRELAHRCSVLSGSRAGHQNGRDYCGSGANARRGSMVYHAVGKILPNVRWPADRRFLSAHGYTTILLGTLGFFGLGLAAQRAPIGIHDQ